MIRTKIDKKFEPLILLLNEHEERAHQETRNTLGIMTEGVFADVITLPLISHPMSYRIVERLAKALLWKTGGSRIFVSDEEIALKLKAEYSPLGARAFDANFMSEVYGEQFLVEYKPLGEMRARASNFHVSGTGKGKVGGIDIGGSEIKMSAIVNGVVLESAKKAWSPKTQTSGEYMYDNLKAAILWAKDKMGGLDSVGISTAGIVVDKYLRASSLFHSMGKSARQAAADIYVRLEKEIGVPLGVANDGDVAAISAHLAEKSKGTLSVSLGTSEAGGYVDARGCLNGLINELAFVPIDMQKSGGVDEWSGDMGCGVNYLSQDAVIRLYRMMEGEPEGQTPSEKISFIIKNCNPDKLMDIYHDIGVYLGYAVGLYAKLYDFETVFLQGGVTGGVYGETIKRVATAVIEEEGFNKRIVLANEKHRNLGQSIAAARLVP